MSEHISRDAMPAVFRSGRRNDLEQKIENIEKEFFPLDKLETIVREFLREKVRGNAEISTGPHITETPEGLQMQIGLDAGMMGGKVVINGMIVNSGNTVGIQRLDIKARSYVRSIIEHELSSFNTEIKTYFKKQSGKSVSSIQIGESGLVVEFENPQVASAMGIKEAVVESNEGVDSPDSDARLKENRRRFLEVMTRVNEKFGAIVLP